MGSMSGVAADLPNDIEELRALVLASQASLRKSQTSLRESQAKITELESRLESRDEEIERLKFALIRLRKMQFGKKSEKISREIDQLELRLEELEVEKALETPLGEAAAPKPKRKPKRKPLPAHLPREPVRLESPCACPDCGGDLHSLGIDSSETLEYVPGHFKVLREEREKFACKGCETVVQAPASSKAIPRGNAGPGLLAHIIVAKYADHLPLYRQSVMYQRDADVELDRSTLAGWVGQCGALLTPLADALGRYVMSGRKLHADDTPVPVLKPGNGKTKTGRFWTYVRDDRRAGYEDPAAVWFQYTPDRKGEHPRAHLQDFKGVLQADGYAGFHHLYRPGRLEEAACWAHVRRKFFEIAESQASPIAEEAVTRIGLLYEIERDIRGSPESQRRQARQQRAAPILTELKSWLTANLSRVSKKSGLAEAIRYALPRWSALTRYVNDGLLEIDNNLAENALRAVALGRKNYLFAGSDAGGERAALMYSLIGTAKLNGINPEAYLRYVLDRIADHPINRIDELLPWHFAEHPEVRSRAA